MKILKAGGLFINMDHVNAIRIEEYIERNDVKGKIGIFVTYGNIDPRPDYSFGTCLEGAEEAKELENKMFKWLNYQNSPNVFDIDKHCHDIHYGKDDEDDDRC